MSWTKEIKDGIKIAETKKGKLTKLGLVGSFLYYSFLAWMFLAAVLGFFVFRALLILVYFLIITPAGLAMRFLKSVAREEKTIVSYWVKYHG